MLAAWSRRPLPVLRPGGCPLLTWRKGREPQGPRLPRGLSGVTRDRHVLCCAILGRGPRFARLESGRPGIRIGDYLTDGKVVHAASIPFMAGLLSAQCSEARRTQWQVSAWEQWLASLDTGCGARCPLQFVLWYRVGCHFWLPFQNQLCSSNQIFLLVPKCWDEVAWLLK